MHKREARDAAQHAHESWPSHDDDDDHALLPCACSGSRSTSYRQVTAAGAVDPVDSADESDERKSVESTDGDTADATTESEPGRTKVCVT